MASISVEKKSGLKRLLFFLGDKRITIHMGPAYKVATADVLLKHFGYRITKDKGAGKARKG